MHKQHTLLTVTADINNLDSTLLQLSTLIFAQRELPVGAIGIDHCALQETTLLLVERAGNQLSQLRSTLSRA